MELTAIKKHLRITFGDDEMLLTYLDWAEDEIKNTVSLDPNRDDSFFDDNETYDRAVTLLVSHFYENRKPITDKPQYNMIYGIKSAIFKLKTQYLYEVGAVDEL